MTGDAFKRRTGGVGEGRDHDGDFRLGVSVVQHSLLPVEHTPSAVFQRHSVLCWNTEELSGRKPAQGMSQSGTMIFHGKRIPIGAASTKFRPVWAWSKVTQAQRGFVRDCNGGITPMWG